jgi:hypothetical protein
MRNKFIIGVLGCALLLTGGVANAGTIKKCKDEDGRWHYGDDAAEACAKTKVIEMTGSGRTTAIIDAPPSAGDLDEFRRKKLEEEEAKKRAAEQAKHDQTLLSTYAHEEDIIYARDRQVGELENSIASGEQTLKSLQGVLERIRTQAQEEQAQSGKVSEETEKNLKHSEEQVARHRENQARKKKEQQSIRERYERDLTRYRELKGAKPAAPTAPTAPAAGAAAPKS